VRREERQGNPKSCLSCDVLQNFMLRQIAPLALLLVTGMLYYFRKVYCEAVTAIPINGGTYNVALNITTKKVAAFVACLSVLSYTATAIISAYESAVYLTMLWGDAGRYI
jgi:amino acid transporter